MLALGSRSKNLHRTRVLLGPLVAGALFTASTLLAACSQQEEPAAQKPREGSDKEPSEQPSEKKSESGEDSTESESSEKEKSPETTPETTPGTSPDEDPGEDEESEIPDPKFDLGAMPKPKKRDNELRPCEIDFLFVVDNSGSMAPRQESLSNSVPNFIKTMMTSTDMEKDYHIGVVTTDKYKHNTSGCNFLGGLVTQTRIFSNAYQCGPFKNGLRFMTDEDDLQKAFTCAAKPGIDGNVEEKTMGSLLGAVIPNNPNYNKCNKGFLRDEAILVAVIITDEDDRERFGGSQGSPEVWYKKLLAAKGGDEKKVVIISVVVPPKPNACGGKPGLAQEAKNIIDFTKRFGKRGFVGDVCKQNYDPIFKKALGVIDFACGELHPPPG